MKIKINNIKEKIKSTLNRNKTAHEKQAATKVNDKIPKAAN